MKPSTSPHNKALREARKAQGLVEIRLWLPPKHIELLGQIASREGLSRADTVSLLLLGNC